MQCSPEALLSAYCSALEQAAAIANILYYGAENGSLLETTANKQSERLANMSITVANLKADCLAGRNIGQLLDGSPHTVGEGVLALQREAMHHLTDVHCALCGAWLSKPELADYRRGATGVSALCSACAPSAGGAW